MEERFNPFKASPEGYKAMAGLQAYVSNCEIEPSLRHLVALRASQINGCAFCLAMHAREAREHGENDDRIHLLNAWREAGVFTPRERAALAWTEALTLLTEGHVPDAVYREARAQFSEKELVDLALAVVVINGWNRIMVAFRRPPETASARAA
ncbi:MAG TPA: carboxymuconolactone decarboxylase family protein [Stellaceae bacterium]|nr:carboxymuconolactone decarboxylase family protein [Stellaceae bacterium]